MGINDDELYLSGGEHVHPFDPESKGEVGRTGKPGGQGERGEIGKTGKPGSQGERGERGYSGQSPTKELLESVRLLVENVRLLNERIHKYPTREEVRREGRKRAGKVLLFGAVLILIAQALTIETISYCFLAGPGERKPGCKFIPGYTSALDESDARLARFKLLISQIEENRADIRLINTRIDKIEADIRRP